MTQILSESPSMEALKKQAKSLLKSHKNRDPQTCQRLRLLRPFTGLADSDILDAGIKLSDCQFAVALGHGFKSWAELKKHVLGRTENLKYLHIHCGDASARPLQNSSVPGDVHVWREIYIEGPVPGTLRESMDPDEDIDTPSLKDIKRWTVTITPVGRDVLNGRKDHIRLNGIDRWLGGVHLSGPDVKWRWDEGKRALEENHPSRVF